jgi:hypothetical protein
MGAKRRSVSTDGLLKRFSICFSRCNVPAIFLVKTQKHNIPIYHLKEKFPFQSQSSQSAEADQTLSTWLVVLFTVPPRFQAENAGKYAPVLLCTL